MTTLFPPEIPTRLRDLAARWSTARSTERASLQSYLLELCDALGVLKPTPPTPDYQFEREVKVVDRDGAESTNFIDLWRADHFALEGKALFETAETSRDRRLRKAFGQVHNYAMQGSGTPVPFLMVLDVARTLIVWDRWSGGYGGYQAGRRIQLDTLHDQPGDIALLRDIWMAPAERDPRQKAQAVTQDLAGRLARFAAALEQRGGDGSGDAAAFGERVARFVIRCVFCCFAEDVGLLRAGLFRETVKVAASKGDPKHFARTLTSLWKAMDTGDQFGADMLNRFNGHFFKSVEALELTRDEMQLLLDAASADWSKVEPTIFGTLLVRALDPVERHRLGAEYTPRAYIERLVKPTVEEPIRERWTAVQAEVLQLEADAGGIENTKPTATQKKALAAALKRLDEFHAWMRGLTFLDPACGSGNFLYVTMDLVKHIELEVMRERIRLSRGQESAALEEVHPRQFHGIEIKPWAREIAELTLWIGYHQWWRETHGGREPPIPILEDTGTLECRDAVLAYDGTRHDPSKDRPDPTPRIRHPVTGELVPDPKAKLEYVEYLNPRPAEWPRANFIVGNPPYIGAARQLATLGAGYVSALRHAYPKLPASADFVMYWWWRSAREVSVGHSIRAGLITTSSITQRFNRAVVSLANQEGAHVIWAAREHPWFDNADAAAVTVAMTVLSAQRTLARLIRVDASGALADSTVYPALNSDLTGHADVTGVTGAPLTASAGLCFAGLEPNGKGFLLSEAQAIAFVHRDPTTEQVIKPYFNGRDLADRSRGAWIIDFGLREEGEARAFPEPFQHVNDHVRPARQANADSRRRDKWWQFGRNNPELRAAIASLDRYIVTVKTSRRRFFSGSSGFRVGELRAI